MSSFPLDDQIGLHPRLVAQGHHGQPTDWNGRHGSGDGFRSSNTWRWWTWIFGQGSAQSGI